MKPYYEQDGIVIYCGDCREVLPQLPESSFGLTFTSPPYNLGNTTGGGFSGKRMGHYDPAGGMTGRGGHGKWSGGALANGYGDLNDNLPHGKYVAEQHAVLRECWRLTAPAGAVFYNHKPRVLDGECVTPLAYNPGLPLRQVVIWARAGGINFSPAFYLPMCEWILVLARPEFRLKSQGASGIGDVWYVPQEANPLHPAPFPLALPARAIETTAPRSVLDPYAGSGTTLLAAKLAGIAATGIERNEEYCEIAANRLAQGVLITC